MKYKGRSIDVVALWSRYVDFPENTSASSDDMYLPKVVCPNPEHDTMKRHFQINSRDGLVHCFAHCGISGTFEHAIATIEGLYDKFKVSEAKDDRERKRRSDRARRQAGKLILAQSRGVEETPSEIIARVRSKNSRSTKSVSPLGISYETVLPPVALEYLRDRGISSASVAKWELGWEPDEKRIVIPGKDENGHLRFVIKRAVSPRQQPKYLYWPEKVETGWGKTDVLFGAGQIDLQMVGYSGLVLVEGSLGAILNHQDGLANTTAILGTGISDQQVKIIARIKPARIYFMFDKDAAGIKNIEIAAKSLRKYPCFVVKFPKGVDDWDEATKRQKERQIDRAVPAFRFLNSLGLSVKQRERNYSFG